jgi:ABC-type uncharacterized transport system permease subunit
MGACAVRRLRPLSLCWQQLARALLVPGQAEGLFQMCASVGLPALAANGCLRPTGAQSLNTSTMILAVQIILRLLLKFVMVLVAFSMVLQLAARQALTSLRYSGSIARVGVNWHFNGPMLAKY